MNWRKSAILEDYIIYNIFLKIKKTIKNKKSYWKSIHKTIPLVQIIFSEFTPNFHSFIIFYTYITLFDLYFCNVCNQEWVVFRRYPAVFKTKLLKKKVRFICPSTMSRLTPGVPLRGPNSCLWTWIKKCKTSYSVVYRVGKISYLNLIYEYYIDI